MAFQLPQNRMLVAGVAAVAAAALVVGGWSVKSTVDFTQAPAQVEATYPFLCGQCGALFDLPRSGMSEETFRALSSLGGTVVDCPKCNTRNSAYVPTRCPACGKSYISEAARGIAPAPGKSVQCPHCGVDPMKWHLQHVKPEV